MSKRLNVKKTQGTYLDKDIVSWLNVCDRRLADWSI